MLISDLKKLFEKLKIWYEELEKNGFQKKYS